MANYNLTAYNLSSSESGAISLKQDCWSYVTGVINASEIIHIVNAREIDIFNLPEERLSVSAGQPLSASSASTVSAVIADLNQAIDIAKDGTYSSTVTAETILASVNYLSADSSSEMEADCEIGAIYYFSFDSESVVDAETNVGGKYYMSIYDNSLFTGNVDFDKPARITKIEIDADIPAGGSLIIDSDGYDVILNNESILHKHSGVWLDELNRNIFSVETVAGTTKYLSYTERYL